MSNDEQSLENQIKQMSDDEVLSRYAETYFRAQHFRQVAEFEKAEEAMKDSMPYRAALIDRMAARFHRGYL